MGDDRELLRRVSSEDGGAAREFVARLEPVARRVVGAYARSPAQADDWTQEVFVRLLGRLDKFDGRAPLEHWAAKVALRVCLDQLRLGRRGALARPSYVAVHRGLGAAARELVGRLLEQLGPEDRVVIQLLDLEERSVADVAELLDRTQAWVKVRAHRARKWLEATCRKWLDE